MIATWYALVGLMLVIYVVLTAATSALGCCIGSWPGRRRSADRSSPLSVRSGPGTKCGWLVSAAR
jgi:hypothetical protein